MRYFLTALLFVLSLNQAYGLDVVQINDKIYALVGEKKQRSAANLANNATFGFVLTNDGIVLIDAGGSWKGAEQIHATLKSISNLPVKFVINTGGQDHRWLGNSYWKKQGATIIASTAAVVDQKERSSEQLSALHQFLGPLLNGTEPSYADITFEKSYRFDLGGQTIALFHTGAAHTPGDSFVWLEDQSTLFSGDIIYIERLLGIASHSNAKSWINVFETIAQLNPKHIIPGHGAPTDLKTAKAQTYDYLSNIRQKIGELIQNGGDMIQAPSIDQSAFNGLEQFDSLAGRNAQQVFTEMEWEE